MNQIQPQIAAAAGGTAFVVWTDLHPAAVQLHFLLSMALVWAAVTLLVRSRETDSPVRSVAVSAPARPLRPASPRRRTPRSP